MNIFKTFDVFLKEPFSILRNNIIQIVNIQTGNIFANKPSCDVTMMKDKTQVTVVNNEKMYNLLSLANYRREQRQRQKQIDNKRLQG
jgi:hypothetical protein